VRRWIREGRLEAEKRGGAYVIKPAAVRKFRAPSQRPRGVRWLQADPTWVWHAVRDEADAPEAGLALCGAWLQGSAISEDRWLQRRQRPPVDACPECAAQVGRQGQHRDPNVGGAAMSAGANYQACVIAYVAVHILAQHQLGWLPPANDAPVALAAETGGPGDDLRIDYGLQREPAEAQIKRGVDATKLRAAIGHVIDRWRATREHVDVVFVLTRASGTVRSGLADDLDRLRANRKDGLSELGSSLLREFGADAEALRDVRIVECAVDVAAGAGTSVALQLLKSVLVEPQQVSVAWRVLIADAAEVSSRRLSRTRDDLIRVLSGNNIAVKPPGPSQRFHNALDASKRMLERGQAAATLTYLDQLERDLRRERELSGDDAEPRVYHRLGQQRAVALFRLGQFSESLSSARRALEFDPRGLHALTIAARAALFAADIATARAFALEATRHHGRDPDAWGVLAEVSSAAGEGMPTPPPSIAAAPRYREFLAQSAASRQDWSRVLDLTSELLALGDRSVDAMSLRIMALLNTTPGLVPEVAAQHCADADRLATELVTFVNDETNPLSAMALTWRSIARRELGRTEDAERDLAEARRRHPDDPEAMRSSANVHIEAENFEAALRVLRDPAAEREPLLLAMRAACFLELGHVSEADADLKASVAQLTPTSPDQARVLAADIAIRLGKSDLAGQLIGQVRVTESFPGPASAQLERVHGRIAFASGVIEEGIQHFRTAADLDAERRWATLVELARRLASAERDGEAASIYREVPLAELTPEALSHSASLSFRLHDYEHAWAIAEHALTRSPVPSWALELATEISLKRDDEPTALRLLRALIERDDAGAEARIVLARCLIESDRAEEAREHIEWLLARTDLTPEDQMATAELLRVAERSSEALPLGLMAFRRARQDPKMHRALAGLVLMGRSAPLHVEAVGPNTHVVVRSPDGSTREWTIYPTEPIDPARNELSVEQADKRGLLGKARGDVVTLGAFVSEVWHIDEILPAIVHVVRDIIDRYEARFPNDPFVQGFRVGTTDTIRDFAPMIRALEARREHVEKALEVTQRQTLPLGFAAHIAGVGVAEVMEGLRTTPSLRPLFVEWANAQGQAQSRETARGAETIVLTRSALETAAQLEMLKTLQEQFVLIAPRALSRVLRQERHTADKATEERTAFVGAGPAGVPWMTQHEPTDPAICRKAEVARAVERWFVANVRVEARPLASVRAHGSREEEARDSVGHDSYDAVHLAADLGAALYADDLGLRRFAGPMSVKSFSTVSLLAALVDRGALSAEMRDRKLVALVGSHYAQIAPTPELLRHALTAGTDDETRQLLFGLLGANNLLSPVDAARIAVTHARENALAPVRTRSTLEVTQYSLTGMAKGWPRRLCADALARAAQERLRFLPNELDAVMRVCRAFADQAP
jgi:tetratricopeptide (TPR) repeat protein